jgi:hypothetical protein
VAAVECSARGAISNGRPYRDLVNAESKRFFLVLTCDKALFSTATVKTVVASRLMKTTFVFVGFLLLATAVAQQHDEPRPKGVIHGFARSGWTAGERDRSHGLPVGSRTRRKASSRKDE